MDSFVLVVMEHTSDWPSGVRSGTAGCVALRQDAGESLPNLLRRTYSHIRAIELVGGTVQQAVLSCGDDQSPRAVEERLPLARALLASVLRDDHGRLDLLARAGASARTKQSLVALAGALTESLSGTSASISARFVPAEQAAA
jgi:hypothetical protein